MDVALWVPEMAQTGESWTEISTANFVNVVSMLHAPAYKWTYTKGAGFGFNMYANEPWHWEYNPPGFQERFSADQPALRPRPEDGLTIDQQAAVSVRVELLGERGPLLGRPAVKRIRTSRHHNMKELRSSEGGALRVLFMFDPRGR